MTRLAKESKILETESERVLWKKEDDGSFNKDQGNVVIQEA